jgi:hypothetical protein
LCIAKLRRAILPSNSRTLRGRLRAWPPKGVKLLPAPDEFVDCKLKDGENFAMSAADCTAKGGTAS